MGWSLFDIAGFMERVGVQGGGFMKLLLILAYLGVLAPIGWRDRRAWLGLLVPIVALLWGSLSLWHSLSGLGGGMMAGAFSAGLGLYLSILAALVLAGGGVTRYLRSA